MVPLLELLGSTTELLSSELRTVPLHRQGYKQPISFVRGLLGCNQLMLHLLSIVREPAAMVFVQSLIAAAF